MGAHRLPESAPEARVEAPASERVVPQLARGAEAALASPALQMQEALAAEFQLKPASKWPPIFGIAFVLGTAAAFWSAVSLALQHLG